MVAGDGVYAMQLLVLNVYRCSCWVQTCAMRGLPSHTSAAAWRDANRWGTRAAIRVNQERRGCHCTGPREHSNVTCREMAGSDHPAARRPRAPQAVARVLFCARHCGTFLARPRAVRQLLCPPHQVARRWLLLQGCCGATNSLPQQIPTYHYQRYMLPLCIVCLFARAAGSHPQSYARWGWHRSRGRSGQAGARMRACRLRRCHVIA